ncbi:MAG: hypothetical protein KGK03_05190 [Candidatus Omnitrophica bacterium]|nr:hypothetical protein [Candidatus Omnitrophota bacterium]MDE2222450.1 hypothetical protein [Candidatus Omnitrophota bacterium]
MLIQMTFFCLLIVALLAGVFSYFPQLRKPIHPLKIAMDSVGYTNVETTNEKKSQQINVAVNSGLMQVRRQMDDISLEQTKIMDALADQQAVLDSASRNANAVLLEAKREGRDKDRDILQLKEAVSGIQDKQRLLVEQGRQLIAFNNQLTKERQRLAQQIDLANMNTNDSFNTIQQHYDMFQNQASALFNKVDEYNQRVNKGVGEIQGQLYGMGNLSYGNYEQQDMFRERVRSLLDKEQEDMRRVANGEQKSRELLEEARDKLADARVKAEDSLQHDRDVIYEQHQKQEDQQAMIRQRIADEEQQMRDKLDR